MPQAVAAERAGFDALNVSDHYQPWWEPGHAGHAWTLSGAAPVKALEIYGERVLPALRGVRA